MVAKLTEFKTCIGEGGFSIGEGGDSDIGRDWIGVVLVRNEGKVIVMVV